MHLQESFSGGFAHRPASGPPALQTRDPLHNSSRVRVDRVGMDCKADFAANSTAIGKKFNAAGRPSPGYHGPRGVMQGVPRSVLRQTAPGWLPRTPAHALCVGGHQFVANGTALALHRRWQVGPLRAQPRHPQSECGSASGTVLGHGPAPKTKYYILYS